MFLKKETAENLKTERTDLDNTYLYEILNKLINIKQPSGRSVKVCYRGHVCVVVKSSYGARQEG